MVVSFSFKLFEEGLAERREILHSAEVVHDADGDDKSACSGYEERPCGNGVPACGEYPQRGQPHNDEADTAEDVEYKSGLGVFADSGDDSQQKYAAEHPADTRAVVEKPQPRFADKPAKMLDRPPAPAKKPAKIRNTFPSNALPLLRSRIAPAMYIPSTPTCITPMANPAFSPRKPSSAAQKR